MSRGRILFTIVVFAAIGVGYYRGRGGPAESFHFTESTRPTFEPLERTTGTERLAGRIETHDGKPAAGIEVFLFRAEPIRATAEPLSWATSDADGRFRLEGLIATEYSAVLTSPSIRPQSRRVTVPPASGTSEFPWRLEEPLAELAPLPEAERADLVGRVVAPASQARFEEIDVEGYEVLVRPLDGVHPLLGAATRRTLTDARGNFSFPGLVAAEYTLELIPPWARSGTWPVLDRIAYSHRATGGGADGAPTLQVRSARIVAKVADQAGLALEGALVLIWPLEDSNRIWPPTRTDASGEFELSDLPTGRYRLRIRAGAATHEETIDLAEGEVKRLNLEPMDPRG